MEFIGNVNWPVAIIVSLAIGIPLLIRLNRMFGRKRGEGEW